MPNPLDYIFTKVCSALCGFAALALGTVAQAAVYIPMSDRSIVEFTVSPETRRIELGDLDLPAPLIIELNILGHVTGLHIETIDEIQSLANAFADIEQEGLYLWVDDCRSLSYLNPSLPAEQDGFCTIYGRRGYQPQVLDLYQIGHSMKLADLVALALTDIPVSDDAAIDLLRVASGDICLARWHQTPVGNQQVMLNYSRFSKCPMAPQWPFDPPI
jgi:hypothetical protein